MKKIKIKETVFCGVFVALTAIGAFIKVPVPVVPFTLQFLFTMLAGLLLGKRLGAISVLVYMFLGLIGLPIFAEGGGLWYLLKPSFGYILGFAAGTYLTGFICERLRQITIKDLLFANFSGLFVVYLMGMAYYYVISNFVINTPISFWPLFLYCFLLAVPGDICLCILGAFLGKRLIPITRELIHT